MGACSHRQKKPILPSPISQSAREFLSYVRPLDLIVFRETANGPIDKVEIAITTWWCKRGQPLSVADHLDKMPPPRSVHTARPRATSDAKVVLSIRSDSEGSEESLGIRVGLDGSPGGRISPGGVSSDGASPGKTSPGRVSPGKASPSVSLSASPRDRRSPKPLPQPGRIKIRAALDSKTSSPQSTAQPSPQSVAQLSPSDCSLSDDEVDHIATGRNKVKKRPTSASRIDSHHTISAEPDSATKLYTWGDGMGNMGLRVICMRSLADLVQTYIEHPHANIGVCRLINNPTVIGPNEPEYRFEARANRVRSQIEAARSEYLGDPRDFHSGTLSIDDDMVRFAAALFPSVNGIASADPMDVERFMRNNMWLRRSEFAAVVYARLGITDAFVDESESVNVGPIDFSGIYLIGNTQPVCDLPPRWAKSDGLSPYQ